jgi:dipeptide/tripeptide permease
MGNYYSERLLIVALAVMAVGSGLVAYPIVGKYFAAEGERLSRFGQFGVFLLSCCAGSLYCMLTFVAFGLVFCAGESLIRFGSRIRAWFVRPASKPDE